jgi:hypothetical protein
MANLKPCQMRGTRIEAQDYGGNRRRLEGQRDREMFF